MTSITKQRLITGALSALLALFGAVGITHAASTISTNIATDGTLAVTGASTLTGNVTAAGTLAVTGASTLTGNVTAEGTLAVTGASTLTGAVTTVAAATVGTDLTVTSGARVGTGSTGGHITALADDSLFVEGQSEFDGIAWFDGSLRASSTLMVTGVSTHGGNVLSDTDSTDSLGVTGTRWASTFSDNFTGETITLDGLTGVNVLTVTNDVADALSIVDSSGDLIVFDTTAGSEAITITPDTTVSGDLTVSGTFSPTQTAATSFAVTNGITVGAEYGLDAVAGGPLNIGTTTATTINIGRSGQVAALLGDATVAGTLTVTGASQLSSTIAVTNGITVGAEYGLDAVAGGPLNIGTTTATTINIGRSGQVAALLGDATVAGTLTVTGTSQLNSTLTVGVDDTGYDVTLFGATAGKRLLWDESADLLDVLGTASTTNLVVGGDGTSLSGIHKAQITDGSEGWNPDGLTNSFTIVPATATHVAAIAVTSFIGVSLDGATTASSTCAVADVTAATNFVVKCAVDIDEGANLNYVIIN
ncbi:MAG: hypothetical protein Q8P93_02565 [bacterium]|nr:hypothetical protein [bacterium]